MTTKPESGLIAHMSKRVTKADLRRELERQVAEYVSDGGEIQQVTQGASGLDERSAYHPPFTDGRGAQPRTPLMDVMAAVDARRSKSAHKPDKSRAAPRKPRKKIIYDDFGEPVREVWED